MASELDTRIVAPYVQVGDLFIELDVRQGPGRPPRFSDAELVCLAVTQVLLGFNSERRWLRFASSRVRPPLPLLARTVRLQQASASKLALTLYRVGVERAQHNLAGAGVCPTWWVRTTTVSP